MLVASHQQIHFAAAASLLTLLVCLWCSNSIAGQQELPNEELRGLLKTAVESSDSFPDRYEAEVWLMDMSNRLSPLLPETEHRLNLLKNIHYEAKRAKLQPELVLAVIDVESRFDRYAISRAGAKGLMQVMPFWLKEIGHPNDNLFNARTNLRMGCTILRYYLDMEQDNITHALARYNGSRNSYTYTNLVFRALDKRWRRR
jgi:soluble lytic murein transglycosylase-like protein